MVAENRRINQDLLIPPGDLGGAKPGQVVVAEIVEQPAANREAIARIKEVLGSATDSGIEIEIALRKHALPFEFSPAAEAQARRLPTEVRAADRKDRVDLTQLPLVTIDGETAKDFDDAVYCERKGRNFRLVVAIADVSHYVRDGDPIDRDARERGTSVYFPRRVIPMLPEELSNEMCSLKPDVDRLCMVCDMEITAAGRDQGLHVLSGGHALARAAHLYAGVGVAGRAGQGQHAEGPRAAAASAEPVRALPRARRRAGQARRHRLRHGRAVHWNSTSTARSRASCPAPRNDAHKLIEECMLAANVCTAEFLAEHKHVALYRVHEGPPPDKLVALRDFLKTSALQSGRRRRARRRRTTRNCSTRSASAPDFDLLQTVLLRSLSQAQYRPENEGHFGLAYEAYTHFTSPIRRYPDLLVHRAIKAVLAGKRYTPSGMTWEELGAHTSMTERRADDASRDVTNWLKCHFMQDKIGEEFEGTISGVTSFGLFVTLDGLNIDGLVHITELGRDYFHFDAGRHALIGERGGRVFQLAGRVRVTRRPRRHGADQDRLHARGRRRAGAADAGSAADLQRAAVARQPAARRRRGAGENNAASAALILVAEQCAGRAWATSSRPDTWPSRLRCSPNRR